jgi:hypothetical protein
MTPAINRSLSRSLDRQRLDQFRPGLARVIFVILALIIITFAGWQIYNVSVGPEIELGNHLELSGFNQTENNIITVSGETKRVAFFYLDDIEQAINADGSFAYDLYMPYGTSTIEVRIQDRYGREKALDIQIYNPNRNTDLNKRESISEDLLQRSSTPNPASQINNE